MKKNIINKLIFSITFIVLLVVPSCVYSGDFKLLEKLILPGAFEIVSGQDKELDLTSIGYKVKIKYPSKKVLGFSDSKLEKLGWKKLLYPDKEGDRQWMRFIDGTTEGEPFVHQLSAYWSNKQKNKMVTLMARYYSYYPSLKEKLLSKKPNTDILDVIVQIGPFVDLNE